MNCEAKIEIYFDDFRNSYKLESSDDGITKIKKSKSEKNNYVRYVIKHSLGQFDIENFENESLEKFFLADNFLEKKMKELENKFPKYDERYLTIIIKVSDLYNIILSPTLVAEFAKLKLEINFELHD